MQKTRQGNFPSVLLLLVSLEKLASAKANVSLRKLFASQLIHTYTHLSFSLCIRDVAPQSMLLRSMKLAVPLKAGKFSPSKTRTNIPKIGRIFQFLYCGLHSKLKINYVRDTCKLRPCESWILSSTIKLSLLPSSSITWAECAVALDTILGGVSIPYNIVVIRAYSTMERIINITSVELQNNHLKV